MNSEDKKDSIGPLTELHERPNSPSGSWPSPDNAQQGSKEKKKSKSFFSNLFKSKGGSSKDGTEEGESNTMEGRLGAASSFESVNSATTTHSFTYLSSKRLRGKAIKGKRIPVDDGLPPRPESRKSNNVAEGQEVRQKKLGTLGRIGVKMGLKKKYNLQSCESLEHIASLSKLVQDKKNGKKGHRKNGKNKDTSSTVIEEHEIAQPNQSGQEVSNREGSDPKGTESQEAVGVSTAREEGIKSDEIKYSESALLPPTLEAGAKVHGEDQITVPMKKQMPQNQVPSSPSSSQPSCSTNPSQSQPPDSSDLRHLTLTGYSSDTNSLYNSARRKGKAPPPPKVNHNALQGNKSVQLKSVKKLDENGAEIIVISPSTSKGPSYPCGALRRTDSKKKSRPQSCSCSCSTSIFSNHSRYQEYHRKYCLNGTHSSEGTLRTRTYVRDKRKAPLPPSPNPFEEMRLSRTSNKEKPIKRTPENPYGNPFLDDYDEGENQQNKGETKDCSAAQDVYKGRRLSSSKAQASQSEPTVLEPSSEGCSTNPTPIASSPQSEESPSIQVFSITIEDEAAQNVINSRHEEEQRRVISQARNDKGNEQRQEPPCSSQQVPPDSRSRFSLQDKSRVSNSCKHPTSSEIEFEQLLRSSPTLMANAKVVDEQVKAVLMEGSSSGSGSEPAVSPQSSQASPTSSNGTASPTPPPPYVPWYKRGLSSMYSSKAPSSSKYKSTQVRATFTHLSKFSDLDREAQRIVDEKKRQSLDVTVTDTNHGVRGDVTVSGQAKGISSSTQFSAASESPAVVTSTSASSSLVSTSMSPIIPSGTNSGINSKSQAVNSSTTITKVGPTSLTQGIVSTASTPDPPRTPFSSVSSVSCTRTRTSTNTATSESATKPPIVLPSFSRLAHTRNVSSNSDPKEQWPCPRCTLKNSSWRRFCEVCFCPRDKPVSISAALSSVIANKSTSEVTDATKPVGLTVSSSNKGFATTITAQSITTTIPSTTSCNSSTNSTPQPETSAAVSKTSIPLEPSKSKAPACENFLNQLPSKPEFKKEEKLLGNVQREMDVDELRQMRVAFFTKDQENHDPDSNSNLNNNINNVPESSKLNNLASTTSKDNKDRNDRIRHYVSPSKPPRPRRASDPCQPLFSASFLAPVIPFRPLCPKQQKSDSAEHIYENWDSSQQSLVNETNINIFASPTQPNSMRHNIPPSVLAPSNFGYFPNPIQPKTSFDLSSAFASNTYLLNAGFTSESETEESGDMERRKRHIRHYSQDEYRRAGAIPRGHYRDGSIPAYRRSASIQRHGDESSEDSSSTANPVIASKLLRKLEWAIAHGEHRLASSLAHDLALLKVNCTVAKSTADPITIRVYVEDRFMQQGPFMVQVTPTMTLKDLKSKIEGDWGIPVAFQKWILGKTMADDDHEPLAGYKVVNDSMAFLYLVTPQIDTMGLQGREISPPPTLPKKPNSPRPNDNGSTVFAIFPELNSASTPKQPKKVTSASQTDKGAGSLTVVYKPPIPEPIKLEEIKLTNTTAEHNRQESEAKVVEKPPRGTPLIDAAALPTSLQAKIAGLRQAAEQLGKSLQQQRQNLLRSPTRSAPAAKSNQIADNSHSESESLSSHRDKRSTKNSQNVWKDEKSKRHQHRRRKSKDEGNTGKFNDASNERKPSISDDDIYESLDPIPTPPARKHQEERNEKPLNNTSSITNTGRHSKQDTADSNDGPNSPCPSKSIKKVEGSCQTTLPFPATRNGQCSNTPASSENEQPRSPEPTNTNTNTVIIANVLVNPIFDSSNLLGGVFMEKALGQIPPPPKSPSPVTQFPSELLKPVITDASVNQPRASVNSSEADPKRNPSTSLQLLNSNLAEFMKTPLSKTPPYFVTKKDQERWNKPDPPKPIRHQSNKVKMLAERFNSNSTKTEEGRPIIRRRMSDSVLPQPQSLPSPTLGKTRTRQCSLIGTSNDNDRHMQAYLEMIQQLEKQDLVPNTEDFECPVCLSQMGKEEGVTLRDCLHNFCRDCLIGAVQYTEDSVVKCPFRNDTYSCSSSLQDREIKALVPQDLFEKYLARSVKLAEHQMLNTYHCKTPDCTGWCIFEDDVNTFKCPVCQKKNCITCAAIHEGMNCHEYQRQLSISAETDPNARSSRLVLESMIQRGDALECPACHVVLLKKWGCDWVRCTYCKTEICWVTRLPRWGPGGKGDTSAGCKCGVNGIKCHPKCTYCH